MKFCLRIISYLVKLLLLLGILFNINISFATDYVISANQTDQIVMGNNDTLTVQSGVTVNTSDDDSVEFEGHSFSTSDTVVTNAGTIIGTHDTLQGQSSTNFTLNNSGTIEATQSNCGRAPAVHLHRANGTVTIVNSGTITSGSSDTIKTHDSSITLSITNSGTISGCQRVLNIGQMNSGVQATLTNSGTISGTSNVLYIYSAGTDVGIGSITNSGTISASNGYVTAIDNVNDVTITNTGTISGTADAIKDIGNNSSNGNVIVNKGTISSGNSDHDIVVVASDGLQSLTNDQGGNDALKLEGYLPVNYVFLANSTSDYGKLAVDSQNGATTFSISTDSALSATTYESVITGVTSTRFTAGTTGTVTVTNGKFNWTLTETSSGSTNWNLVVTNFDSTAPTLSSSTPADNGTGVAVNANIVLTFSEEVDAESGNITIKKTSDDSTIETIDVTGAKVSGSGGTEITINPGTDWDQKTEYYVLIDSSAFDDAAGNSYAGISSTTALSFTSIDSTDPSLSSSTPADGGTDIEIDANIVLTFSEAVDTESGYITIKKSSDDSTFEAIDVTGSLVSGSGSTEITINPSNDLTADFEFYILIDATAFDDTSGNSYAGISSKTALNFKTKPGDVFSETVKTLTKNQSTASVQTMTQSVTRVNSRMNYIRPGSNNTFRQNVRLAMNFDDPFANQLFDSLAQKFLKPKKETKGWAVWTEGNISFGRVANHDGNLGQDIHSDGVTVGIDKKITENKTVGFAINKAWQETEVGSNEANMDASAISLMTYSSFKLKESTYFETAIGVGEMDIDLDREVTSGRNKGVRKGNQLFGSFTYLLEPETENEEKNLNYYTRIDLGFTQLGDYTETGDGTAAHYNKQNVKTGSMSVGFNLRKIIEIENGIMTPLLKLEVGKDKTVNSLSEAYYINDSSNTYANAIADQSSSHALLSLGLGAQLNGDFTINASYDHYRNSNESFMNSFSINLRKSF